MVKAIVAACVLVLSAGRALAIEPLAVATSHTLYVPTSASIHGNAGAFFHTDLWALNRSFTAPLTVTATYRCFAGPCAASTKPFTLAPRESKLISDLDATLFLEPETAGAIELSYTSASEDLTASTRTYTPTLPSPTNGTSIPALTLADARSRAVFLGLGSNGGNLAKGFRTNAGAFFPFGPGYSTTVTWSLFKSDGTLLGSATQTLQGPAAGQINDIFAAAGAASTVTTNAYLVLTSNEAVFPFVTVIDNQSGDSVFVPAASDVPAAPVTSLVSNGGFDSTVTGWSSPSPYWSFSPATADSHGSPSSGSMLIRNSTPQTGSSGGPLQCLPVSAGLVVNYGARFYVPSGQTATGHGLVHVYLRTGANCAGGATFGAATAPSASTDEWVPVSGAFTVPAGYLSAEVGLWTGKTDGTGDLFVYADDVFLSTSSR